MVSHLESVYNGQYLDTNHQPIELVASSDLPFFDPPQDADANMFSKHNIACYINQLPRRKAPGVDHLRAEMLQPIQYRIAYILSMFFRLCWSWRTVPTSWRHAQVFPIHKKGDPTVPANYRPISLTSILRKLLEMILQPCLIRYSPPLDLAQGGFRAQRSALDQALCLHDLIQDFHNRHHGANGYPVIAFLDIKAAYDTVDRNVIWTALQRSGTPLPLLGLLQHLFDDVSISVLIDNCTSLSFQPITGVLQGSVLSPLLYSIYINTLPAILRAASSAKTTRVRLPIPPSRRSNTKRYYPTIVPINSLLFADDVAIFGTKLEVQTMLHAAEEHSMSLGYRWNPLKCAVLNHPESTDSSSDLKLYNVALPHVEEFVYLGIPFRKKGISGSSLVKIRAAGSMAAMSTLHKMGANRSGFSLLLSSKLYRTFIRPKFEYGIAITKFLKKDITALEKIQDRCLRLLVGGSTSSSMTVLKLMTNLPSMVWRRDVLTTKYCLRITSLPSNCLLILLQRALSLPSLLSKYLEKNRLFRSLPTPWPSSNAALTKFFKQDRQLLLDSTMETITQVLTKACRNTVGIDPILYLPATRTDRSRLLRWRMGWLPGKPHDCICTRDHTSRRHFDKYECEAIPTALWDELPPASPGVHYIDNAITLLPTNASKYCSYWPSLLTLLWYIECNVHPDGFFPVDSDPGARWRDLITQNTSTSIPEEP
jgi:hypothetical protein